MTILREHAHLTYPNMSGFHGDRVLLSTMDGSGSDVGIVSVRADGSDEQVVWTAPAGPKGLHWFDCTEFGDLLCTSHDGVLTLLDLSTTPAAPRELYRPPDGSVLDGLVSFSRDGQRIAAIETTGERRRLLEVAVDNGSVRELCTVDWWANHAGYSPYDDSWISFAHEGPASRTPDRVWAWHATRAPRGRPVLDQYAISDTPGVFVAVGHERWLHHDLGAAVVAYGESPAGPRGLYFVHPDGRPPALVAAGNRFWHCDVSRDGRFAVVDTKGPWDFPGRDWPDKAPVVCDIVHIDLSTGEQTPLARTHGQNHPRHPHPVFTPDGSAVLFNDTDADLTTVRVARIPI